MAEYPARPCAECGKPFKPRTYNGRFCAQECKVPFMNRRRQRGAQVYDFLMMKRFERGNHEVDARGMIDRLASAYRDADKAERDGRPSWNPWDIAVAEVPLAYSTGGDGR